jgi:branched-chain amino acid transport system substrate-binding protein
MRAVTNRSRPGLPVCAIKSPESVFMYRMRFFFLLMGFVILLPGPCPAETVKVGVLLPLTGRLSESGLLELNSFTMAAEEINARGDGLGPTVELIVKDTCGESDAARIAVKEMVTREGVVIITGLCSSDAAFAAAAEAEAGRVPLLITTAAADKITEQGWVHVFRLCSASSEHHRSLAAFLREIAHVRTAAILSEETPFGRYERENFYRIRKEVRIRTVRKDLFAPPVFDFKHTLSRIKERDPDLVYVIARSQDAALALKQAREVELSPRLWVGVPKAFLPPAFKREAGESGEYVFTTALWLPCLPYPGAKAFSERYRMRYALPPGYHGAQAYAAMQVIEDALRAAADFTPEGLRIALTESDMMSVYGPVRFLSYGKKAQQNRLPAPLVQWLLGRPVCVWPREISTARYVYPPPTRREDGIKE